MNPRTIQSCIAGLILSVAVGAVAAGASGWNTNEKGVVLDGYDVVAYFNEDRAVQGRPDFSARHEGVQFHFSSRENLEAFEKDPGKYTPKFGGFCAFGVAANRVKAPTNPATFKIYNGELLLFFNDIFQGKKVNTKVLWNQDEGSLYEKAAETWPTLE